MGGSEVKWYSIVAVLLVLAPVAPTEAAGAGEQPNIVFITSDDHRWDGLGAAGNPAVRTPALDKLAGQGVLFRQAITSVSQCLPSRATLVTGLPAHQHGALSHEQQHNNPMRPDALSKLPTVPGLLRQAGYNTVLVGKWHLEAEPWQSGFSGVKTWLPTGGALYQDPDLAKGKNRKMSKVKGYTQAIFADDAVAFLKSGEAKKGPFLLWLAFTAPHHPFAPNPSHIEKHYHGQPAAELLPPGFPKDIPTGDWRRYYEAISYLDQQVGRVMEALEGGGLDRPTVLVFLGDNGFMMGQRGVGAEGPAGKVVPYEGSVRVPMILWSPKLRDLAGPSDLPVSTLDVPPTLLALAGLEAPASWSGRNLLPALRDPKAGPAEAFAEWADEGGRFGAQAHRLVRTPRHKLILWKDPARPDELYDLAADPEEKSNLIAEPEARPVLEDLKKRLKGWMEKTSDPALKWE
ncbi:MAG TPA: sulfatase-like hydrolase/transferase [Thermoanaerobaculia bacterium]|nr:sulfatase-like hydrolase/transferase [Thermoanaerobaculia bacterium]